MGTVLEHVMEGSKALGMTTTLKELLQNLQEWLAVYPGVWTKAYTEMEGFLKDSYLVVVFYLSDRGQDKLVQLSVRDFLQSYRQRILDCPSILKDAKDKRLYLRRLGRKAGDSRLELLERLLEVEAYTIEPRFPSLIMDFIQRLKETLFVNQELTDIDKATIRIRLKQRPC